MSTGRPAEPEEEPPRAVGSLWRDGFGRVATRCVQIIAVLAVVVVAIYVMSQVGLVLIPVMIALILASAIHPFVAWMIRRGVPAMLGTWIAMLAILVVFGGLGTLIGWTVRREWHRLAHSARIGVAQLERDLGHLPFTLSAHQLSSIRTSLEGYFTSSGVGHGAIVGVSYATETVTGLFLTIVVLFFFLKDGPRIWAFLLRPFRGRAYERAARVGHKTVVVLGDYVRGTIIVAAVESAVLTIVLLILQVPLAFPLAVLFFLAAFVPIVGAVVIGALAALVALVASGPLVAIIVIAVVVAVFELENHFLRPVVMGRTLRLHALVVLLALAVGIVVDGVLGAVLAVPIAAVAWGIGGVWHGDDAPAKPFLPKDRTTV